MFSEIDPNILKEMGFTDAQIKEGIELGITLDEYLTRTENPTSSNPNNREEMDSNKAMQEEAAQSNQVSPLMSDHEVENLMNNQSKTFELKIEGKTVLESRREQVQGGQNLGNSHAQKIEPIEIETSEGIKKRTENAIQQIKNIKTEKIPTRDLKNDKSEENIKTAKKKPKKIIRDPEREKKIREARVKKRQRRKMKKIEEMRLRADDQETKMVV